MRLVVSSADDRIGVGTLIVIEVANPTTDITECDDGFIAMSSTGEFLIYDWVELDNIDDRSWPRKDSDPTTNHKENV